MILNFSSCGFPCFHNKRVEISKHFLVVIYPIHICTMYINMSLFQVQSSVGSVRTERSLFYITGSGCVWATCRSKMQRLLAFFTVGLCGFRKFLIPVLIFYTIIGLWWWSVFRRMIDMYLNFTTLLLITMETFPLLKRVGNLKLFLLLLTF